MLGRLSLSMKEHLFSQQENALYVSLESTKEGSLPYILFESPFASVSTVSRDPPL